MSDREDVTVVRREDFFDEAHVAVGYGEDGRVYISINGKHFGLAPDKARIFAFALMTCAEESEQLASEGGSEEEKGTVH